VKLREDGINRKNFLLVQFFICIATAASQVASAPSWFPGEENTSIGGYVKELPFIFVYDDNWDDPEFGNLVHFRLNTRWYPVSFLTFEGASRLQALSGTLINPQNIPFPVIDRVADALSEDRGYADLTDAWPAILFANIDRAWVSYTLEKLTFTIGRQRINWGTNFVWNPNDWFNAFSFLDFDYEERPGSDAFRVQYYTSVTSVAELALEAGKKQRNRTFAALYKMNMAGYDFQVQSGLFGLDAALGFSWAGSIRGGAFRGEIAYFHPVLADTGEFEIVANDTSGALVAALSGDYTFSNSLYLHGEVLYNGNAQDRAIRQLTTNEELSAKNLLPATYAVFGEVSYQVTPLLRGTMAASLNPATELDSISAYLSPSLSWSVFSNIELLILTQLFFGNETTLYGALPHIGTARVRWSF